jgi:hypothetical protein
MQQSAEIQYSYEMLVLAYQISLCHNPEDQNVEK